jgi:hypothetical protein
MNRRLRHRHRRTASREAQRAHPNIKHQSGPRRPRALGSALCRVCVAALVLAGLLVGTSLRAATVAQRASASPGSPVRYGISANYLRYAHSPAGRALRSLRLGRTGRVRIFVPYDALGFYDGRGCAPSPARRAGEAAWRQALASVGETLAVGLTPEIEIESGTGVGWVPVTPDPASRAQAQDYGCGVRAIMRALFARLHASRMPLQFEAWNEPDNSGYSYHWDHSCSAPATKVPSCSGPWRAAMLWYLAQTQANYLHASEARAGFPVLTIAAMTLSAPRKMFFFDARHVTLSAPDGRPYNGYYQSLWRIVRCVPGFGGCEDARFNPAAMPSAWALHDYDDPTAVGHADLRAFERALAALNDTLADGAGATLWITEAGVQLDSQTRSDLNRPHGVTCAGTDADRADSNTFACIQDGHPRAQAAGARAWMQLGAVRLGTSRGMISVSELYWYHFELDAIACAPASPCTLGSGAVVEQGHLPQLHAWDSALVDSHGAPRPSFCAITSQPTAACAGNANAYETARWYDWWQASEMPSGCPEHFGAWVARKAHSTVPSGQECIRSTTELPGARFSTPS